MFPFSLWFAFMFVCLFLERERERVCTSWGEAERDEEGES